MPIKVAILSAGLGNIHRGFENSAATWSKAIKGYKDFEVRLFAGGIHPNATQVLNLPRNSKVSSFMRRACIIKDGARLEQITFSIGLLYHLVKFKPDVVWLQEGTLGSYLLLFRKIFSLRYKIVFCDGAPAGPIFSNKFDYIVFLHEYALIEALQAGIDIRRTKVIPHLTEPPKIHLDKGEARRILNIASNRFIIICVAAWNKHHKRIDYLLRETAKIDKSNITLLLCGQSDLDTDDLKNLGKELNIDICWNTFNQDELSVAYSAADIFVLPSISEALGAVLIEAGFHNLPIICHPHGGGKSILGETYEGLTDLTKSGNLSAKIETYRKKENLSEEGVRTGKIVAEKFSADKLTESFVEFIKYAVTN